MVLDCDHVVSKDFLTTTLPTLCYHDDVAMVITRQNFRNVDPAMDVLNHINGDYFDLMQPGMDALDFISCPGKPHQLLSDSSMCILSLVGQVKNLLIPSMDRLV